MKCPFCNHEDTKVSDTRSLDENTSIRRRRLCEKCGARFTTFERIDYIPLVVIKSNGTREPFDRRKVLDGIIKSCNKRSVSMSQMENIVDEIENIVLGSLSKEIETKQIGELVMEKLKIIDEVAYVRFASVYKQFTDIDKFMAELTKLIKEKA